MFMFMCAGLPRRLGAGERPVLPQGLPQVLNVRALPRREHPDDDGAQGHGERVRHGGPPALLQVLLCQKVQGLRYQQCGDGGHCARNKHHGPVNKLAHVVFLLRAKCRGFVIQVVFK